MLKFRQLQIEYLCRVTQWRVAIGYEFDPGVWEYIKFFGICMLVLLWLLAIQVEIKWRKNLLISEPLCQICILQLKWCFNLEMKV